MVWWQGVLVILGSVVAGSIVGFLSAYVILRIHGMPWLLSWEHVRIFVAQAPRGCRVMTALILKTLAETVDIEIATTEPADSVAKPEEETESVGMVRDTDAECIREKQEPTEGEERVSFRVSSILREVEMNLAIAAAAPWTGRLSPFQTDIWGAANGEIGHLPANVQYELAEAYVDMHLANRIVWLSTDVGRRSKHLDESYIQICARITERLNNVNPSLQG